MDDENAFSEASALEAGARWSQGDVGVVEGAAGGSTVLDVKDYLAMIRTAWMDERMVNALEYERTLVAKVAALVADREALLERTNALEADSASLRSALRMLNDAVIADENARRGGFRNQFHGTALAAASIHAEAVLVGGS